MSAAERQPLQRIEAVPADQLAGAQQRGFIDQVGAQHGGGEDRPGLDHEPRDAALGQQLEHSDEIEPAVGCLATRRTSTPAARSACSRVRRRRRAGDDPSGVSRAVATSRVSSRQPQRAIEHHAHRRAVRHAGQPAGQQRIIGQHGTDAGQHGVVHGPHQMHAGACRLAGDRRGVAAGETGFAVGRDRELEDDLRTALAHAPDMAGVGLPRLVGADPDLTAMPAAAMRRWPSPATCGLGSSSADTTRAMPAAMMASAQGGVRPWWEQGSKVT